MKFFFYSVVGIYLFLYFYAVYAYEGFTLYTALSVLLAFGALGWLLMRGWSSKSQPSEGQATAPVTMAWYQSPFPYLVVIVAFVLIAFLLG